MQSHTLELEAHICSLDVVRRGKWAMVRIMLNWCLQVIKAKGSEIPTEWQVWQVETELTWGNWDGVNSAAKYVSRLSFFFLVCFGCCTNVHDLFFLIVMCYGCSPTCLMCLCSIDSFSSFVASLCRHYKHTQSALRFDPGHKPVQMRERGRAVR
jgi:hypothetical protein